MASSTCIYIIGTHVPDVALYEQTAQGDASWAEQLFDTLKGYGGEYKSQLR